MGTVRFVDFNDILPLEERRARAAASGDSLALAAIAIEDALNGPDRGRVAVALSWMRGSLSRPALDADASVGRALAAFLMSLSDPNPATMLGDTVEGSPRYPLRGLAEADPQTRQAKARRADPGLAHAIAALPWSEAQKALRDLEGD